jgi:hypothetical protein
MTLLSYGEPERWVESASIRDTGMGKTVYLKSDGRGARHGNYHLCL